MTIALLISTYNYSEALDIIIDGISKQVHLPDEIIIAEDGKDPKTFKVVNSWKKKISSRFIHVTQKDLGFRKALVLNKAIQLSKSDYIIQIDGDCIPDKYFVIDHKLNAKKGCYLYGTRVHIKNDYISKIFWYYKYKNKRIIFSFFSPNIKKRFRKLRIPFLSQFYCFKDKISPKFRGCNTSFWKKDFIDVNGYNNQFNGWGREDSDLMIRFHNNGLKSKRLKFLAIVYHLDHGEKDRSKFYKNDLLQNDSVLRKKIRVDDGLLESINEV